MKEILKLRSIFWKKQWLSILFWILFPMIICLIIMNSTQVLQDDTKVPIGLVVNDDTEMANQLVEKIQQSSLIRPFILTEKEAIHQVETHALDSAFIIHEGYEEKVRSGNRNNLLTGYYSNMSFGYPTIKEMVISFVQEETVRSKAAHTIIALSEEYDVSPPVWEEIMNRNIKRQLDEDLMNSTFLYANSDTSQKDNIIGWNVWGLWTVFAFLSSLLLMDWVIKEKHSPASFRFAFLKLPLHRYLLFNLILYVGVFLIMDAVTMMIFNIMLQESISFMLWLRVISYRIVITLLSFLLALCFKKKFIYYSISFMLTLLMSIISGVIIPIEGFTNLTQVAWLSPSYEFLSNQISIWWLAATVILLILWFIRKEIRYA